MTLTAKTSTTARLDDTIRSGGYVSPAFELGLGQKLMACALWDDTIDGHVPAVDQAGMGLDVWLPNLAFVLHSFMNVLVVPVGPTELGVTLESDADIVGSSGDAIAISGAPWSTVGLKQGAVVRTDTTAEEWTTQIGTAVLFGTTAAREVCITNGATPVVSSAGRVAIYIEFVVTPSATQGAS
jgi:hypothetical protein